MKRSQEIPRKFASSKSQFFDLPDGQEAQVKFLYVEIVPNNFDGGKTQCTRYHFEVDGYKQMWDRTSRELAKQMAQIPEGSCISIKRTGQKNKTKYIVKEVE